MKRRNPELEVMIKLERIPEVHKKTSQVVQLLDTTS